MAAGADGQESRRVDCPHCGAPQSVTPVTVIRPADATLQDLYHGTLNRVSCDQCGMKFLLDTPVLFRDDEARVLIYYVPMSDPRQWAAAEASMQDVTRQVFAAEPGVEAPECRLTLTRNTFIEKISLHLHRLEDRLVEYVKYQLYNNSDGKIDPVRHELLYDFSVCDEQKLPFLVFDRESGRATAATHLPMDVYCELADTFLADNGLKEELEQLFPGSYVSTERLL